MEPEAGATAAMVIKKRCAELWNQRSRISMRFEASSSEIAFQKMLPKPSGGLQNQVEISHFGAILDFFADLAPPLTRHERERFNYRN